MCCGFGGGWRVLLAACATLVWAGPTAAQQGTLTDPLLERMAGEWVLQGRIGGQQTTHDVRVAWVLQHEYLQLTEVAREKKADGTPAYEAIVYIGADPTRPGYACLWLDNTGGGGLLGRAIAHADPPRGDSLAFVFELGPAGTIYTTFAYQRASDRWSWAIDNQAPGGAREPFARTTLVRGKR